jgi:hypothetical protein
VEIPLLLLFENIECICLGAKVRMLVSSRGKVVGIKIFIRNPLTLDQTGFLTFT